MLEEAIANQVSDAHFLLPLLGKIQMKAGRWRDGVDSFKKCIAIIVSTGRIFSFWQSSGCLFWIRGQHRVGVGGVPVGLRPCNA